MPSQVIRSIFSTTTNSNRAMSTSCTAMPATYLRFPKWNDPRCFCYVVM